MMWSPALEGADAARARAVVAEVAEELARRDVVDPSLGFGSAAVAMLQGYRALAGEADEAEVTATLERVLERITDRPNPWLFSGYAGIAFTAHHLADVIGPTDELLADLEPLIVQPLAAEQWKHEWELQSGLIGLGVYVHTRGLTEQLHRVISHLAARAHREVSGLTWLTHGSADNYNLGICHGVAGAVAFLATICADPTMGVGAEPLLREAVPWLRACERAHGVPTYPMELGAPSPLQDLVGGKILNLDGWCYGDPSTALVLVRAGQAIDERGWVEAGRAIARRAAARTDDELATVVMDQTFCHGRVGRAHLFHHLAVLLDDADLMVAARQWYLRALDDLALDTPDVGLQTGLSGIALALLGSYRAEAPRWGRALLIT